MKSLKLEGKRQLKLYDTKDPEIVKSEIRVFVEATGIGGSEYLGYDNPGIRPLPNIMGHGFTGTTTEGNHVAVYPLLGCGDCHYCKNEKSQLCADWSLIGVQSDGGFSQRVSVPETQLVQIPRNLSWEKSVFIEPFANSINAWQLSKTNHAESVAILGLGGLGLGLTACAFQHGCESIDVADFSENRRNAALSLGATEAQPELSHTYDVVFDTVGSSEARHQALQKTKKGGRCIFLGFGTQEVTVNMSEIIRKQQTLMGSFAYSRKQFLQAIDLVELCDDSWVVNVKFGQVEDHLKRFLDGDFSCIKPALRPNKH